MKCWTCTDSDLYINCESHDDDSMCTDMNSDIVNEVLLNTDRTPDGQIVIPLPWNKQCKEKLGHNYNLSRKILEGNGKKLIKEDKLMAYDAVFKEQEQLGIIE